MTHPGTPDEPADDADTAAAQADSEPLSTSWRVIQAPWGTPGDHLTGPIPRIRRRADGELTHGEES